MLVLMLMLLLMLMFMLILMLMLMLMLMRLIKMSSVDVGGFLSRVMHRPFPPEFPAFFIAPHKDRGGVKLGGGGGG